MEIDLITQIIFYCLPNGKVIFSIDIKYTLKLLNTPFQHEEDEGAKVYADNDNSFPAPGITACYMPNALESSLE